MSIEKTCQTCVYQCSLELERGGRCGLMYLRGGSLVNVHEGLILGATMSPIEHVPLYHFSPGSRAFNIWVAGCPVSCKTCVNPVVKASLRSLGLRPLSEDLIDIALRSRSSIAFVNGGETLLHAHWLLKQLGEVKGRMPIGFKTTCSLTPKALKSALDLGVDVLLVEVPPTIDQVLLENVAPTIKIGLELAKHVEVMLVLTPYHTVIPAPVIEALREHKDVPVIVRGVGVSSKTLHTTWRQLREHGLNYVYVYLDGDVKYSSTYCPKCKNMVIVRERDVVVGAHIANGKCVFCNSPLYITGEPIKSRSTKLRARRVVEAVW